MIKTLILIILAIALYSEDSTEDTNIKTLYHSTDPVAAAAMLLLNCNNLLKFDDTKQEDDGLNRDFEYLKIIDKNTRKVSK